MSKPTIRNLRLMRLRGNINTASHVVLNIKIQIIEDFWSYTDSLHNRNNGESNL